YNYDISHWSNASSLPATCTVEPSSAEQIQELIGIITSTRTPWAVKGAGHCNNNNMSSTQGLLISMSNFRDISLSPDKSTVKLGMGLTWIEVYTALAVDDLVVVGGRFGPVGVGGLSLSSGYSWYTNQYGFATDNVVSYEIVLPNGNFTTVTQESNPDLFFALQGGVNNFGIVTNIELKTHPLNDVFAGVISVSGNLTAALQATANYAKKTQDTKATATSTISGINGTVKVFHDGPDANGLFDEFLAIPGATVDVQTRTYLQYLALGDIAVEPTNRATWYSAPTLSWPPELIEFIHQQVIEYSSLISTTSKSGIQVTGNIEPFLPSAYSHSSSSSAWPHSSSTPFNTFNGLFMWTDPEEDSMMIDLTIEYHTRVWEKAIELGVSSRGSLFPPNYSQSSTSVEMIYGPNLERLRRIKASVDPADVISLTGGFKI
ncbi:FAD-binding domain-containing protein, partial [Dendrothele bispora CBS 962.96]